MGAVIKPARPQIAPEVKELIGRCNMQVRPYQGRVVTKIAELADKGHKSVLLESPTGSGKTSMMLLTGKLMQEAHGYSFGYMAMNRNLLEQAEHENKVKAIGLDMKIISMFDKNPPKCDALLIDEAQHDSCASAAHIHNVVQPKFILGCTATPYRTDRVKLCFERVVKDIGIHNLIKQGYLSPYAHFGIQEWTPASVVAAFLRGVEKSWRDWGKSIFFFLTEKQCYEAKSLLAQAGIVSEVVSAKTDRETQLDAFRQGVYPVMIGMKTIAEGIDVPDLKTVFVRDSQRGPTIQMSGRVFRIHPDHPVKQIVQSQCTKWPMMRTATPLDQWIQQDDGSWRSVKPNPHINAMVAANTKMIARITTTMPKFIKDHAPQKWRKWLK